MKQWMYYFTITVIDEPGSVDSPATYKQYSGLGFADTFSEAASALEESWGDDLISINHLELCEDYSGNTVLLPKEIALNLASGAGWDTGISTTI